MRGFRGESGGVLSARLSGQERDLLASLAGQVATMVSERESVRADPALRRLLPDAYRGDDAAAAEFRKYTEDSLAERKIQNALTMIRTLESATPHGSGIDARLDAPAAQAWLRALTDIRLTIAARLGIEADGDEGPDDEEGRAMREVYDWLGFVQGSLVEALDG
jgi:hypothetical protein